MHFFITSFALIISLLSLLINNADCSPEGMTNLTNEISSIYFDIEEFQRSLSNGEPSSESLVKIVRDLSSTLILMLSQLESSKSFENAFIAKMQNLHSEMEELRKDVNETECSLSIRIIEIENNISKLKEESVDASEVQSTSSTENTGRKAIINREFLLTPSLPYRQARMYCRTQGGTPFVPKTMDEFYYIVERVTREDEYGWIPLTDILDEGMAEWDDGTSYNVGPLRLEFADHDSQQGNSYDKDCVDVNKEATADWYDCSKLRKILCILNEKA